VEAITVKDPSQHPIRTAIVRATAAAFAVAALSIAAVTGAYAQSAAPAPDQTVVAAEQAATPATQPAAQPNPAPPAVQPILTAQATPAPRRAAPTPPPLSHWPIIDLTVTYTQPAYYLNNVQLINYDPLDIGGTVRIPVTRKINLLFDRIVEGTTNQPLERAINPATGLPILSAASRDAILQYHATYTFDRFLTMDVGNSFRHRIYAYRVATLGPNTFTPLFNLTNISARPFPDTINSTEHHFSYAGFTYTSKPWKEFLRSTFAFSLTADVQNVDHNVAIQCTAPMIAAAINRCAGLLVGQVGYQDMNPGKDKFWETTQGITWIWPIDPKHGTSFTLNERWGALNFYENAPFPYRWNSALTYQLNKRFSPGFQLSMRHSDFHAIPQGAPFPFPNAIHVGSWDLIGTFHFETKTWFGQ
jgi:hypothetical protein